MNKRYIYLIGIIISCITLLTACSVKVDIDANVNSEQEIEIEEYYMERNEFITIETNLQDNELYKIELGKKTITINNVQHMLPIDDYDDVISLGVADLNCDGEKEILVCHMDMLISPSYRKWVVYNKTGEYIMDIYDGDMTYNIKTHRLTVIHSIHEMPKPTYQTDQYEF